MNILLLSHKVLHPMHCGHTVHLGHFARQIGRDHELHLVALGRGELPPEASRHFASVQHVAHRRLPRPTGWKRVANALRVDRRHDDDPAVHHAIERVLAESEIDLVWTGGPRMLAYSHPLAAAGLPVLADLSDEEVGEHLAELRRARSVIGAARALRDAARSWLYQRTYLSHVPLATVVSERDRVLLRRCVPRLDVRVVPNGVDEHHFVPAPAEDESPLLVFEGSMDFPPNVDGIASFCRRILPRIRARRPDVQLAIVGRDPAPAVRALEGPGVIVTGTVPDVRPWLSRAALFVCPLWRGTGIKNKILQAWSMERAVVATPRSCLGVRSRPGENVVVADRPRDFARAVLQLLDDAPRRARLGAEGRRTVLEHYTWEIQGRRLETLMRTLVGGKEAPRPLAPEPVDAPSPRRAAI